MLMVGIVVFFLSPTWSLPDNFGSMFIVLAGFIIMNILTFVQLPSHDIRQRLLPTGTEFDVENDVICGQDYETCQRYTRQHVCVQIVACVMRAVLGTL